MGGAGSVAGGSAEGSGAPGGSDGGELERLQPSNATRHNARDTVSPRMPTAYIDTRLELPQGDGSVMLTAGEAAPLPA